jgi:threonine dehydratase
MTAPPDRPLPDRDAIAEAARRIAPRIRRTPVIEAAEWGAAMKLELLQVSGSFKPRGAFNRMLSAPIPPAGVIAASGGNHGAAVAHAAQALGVRAEIFVPDIASPAKLARIRDAGATLVQGGARYDDAAAAAAARAAETGALMVHAYDQPEVLAGQGTVAREFAEQTPGLSHVLVALGGGGLAGGMACWWGGAVRLVVVEPEASCCWAAARAAGRPVPVPVSGIAADSLGAREVGGLAFAALMAAGAESVTVPDAAIAAAQRALWARFRLVAEPGGAAALAALLAGAWAPPAGARVGVLVCGANTDPGSVA